MTHKSLMATALCTVGFAGASFCASAAQVQVYGLIDTGLSLVSSDADVDGMDRTTALTMETGREFGSRWGLRGTEDLGGGYKIGFVLESGLRSDDGTSDQNKLFGRESHIDIYAPWGTVYAGLLPVFGSTLGANGLFRAIDPLFANYTKAFGSGYLTASSWTRVDNALAYKSPSFGPFTAYAMYSFKNSVNSVGVEGKSSTDRYGAFALRYLSGAFEAVLVADTTLYGSARTGNSYTDDNGWTVTLGGNYTFGNGVKVLAFGQGFGDMALNTAARAGVTYDGINAITGGLGYGFVTGWGAGLGIHIPAAGGVLKGSVGYRDMDNQWDTDFKRIVASVGYDYPLSKRTALYAMGGYSREKVDTNDGASAKPDGYELTMGMVHRF